MHFSNILLATLVALPLSYAQQAADGLIVPFTSKLPVCASKCGPLYDVQGACTPPNIASVDNNCFCTDGRLAAFNTGSSGVSSVCGPGSCTSSTDLDAVRSWYQGLCGNKAAAPSTTRTTAPTASSTGKSNTNTNTNNGNNGGFTVTDEDGRPWIQTHWKWLVMIAVIIIAIISVWVGAWILRKRHLRKKEREFEMGSPHSWKPNTTDSSTYGDGVLNGRGDPTAGGFHKESGGAGIPPANGNRLSKQKMGWFKSARI